MEREIFLLAYQSKYLHIIEFRFAAMLSSNLGNETSVANNAECSRGRVWPMCPETPHH